MAGKGRLISYTYSGNPNSSAIDAVHYLLGDTNPSSPISTDEECAFSLAQNGNNIYLAAAAVADTKALELINRPTTVKRGDRSTTYADPVLAFQTLARQLRNNASIATATVYAGGQSVSEKDSARRDRDLVQPFARANLHMPRHVPAVEDWEREA